MKIVAQPIGGIALALFVTSAGTSVSHAATITLALATAVFTGGAGTIANGSKIKFDPNTPGETATFTLSSV
jgi:hypothetical protein